MSENNRKEQKENILKFLESKEGIAKLKACGVSTEDDFEKTLPMNKILKSIAYNKISLEDFSKSFGEEWVTENWSCLLEILHANVEPDCLILTVNDTKGNKIFSAYINSFQLFGSYEYKQAICGTVANSLFRTLVSLPTERELIQDLKTDNEDCIEFIKNQLDYFKDDGRNQTVLDLVAANSPSLRKLIKEKTGY